MIRDWQKALSATCCRCRVADNRGPVIDLSVLITAAMLLSGATRRTNSVLGYTVVVQFVDAWEQSGRSAVHCHIPARVFLRRLPVSAAIGGQTRHDSPSILMRRSFRVSRFACIFIPLRVRIQSVIRMLPEGLLHLTTWRKRLSALLEELRRVIDKRPHLWG